jgi:glycogen phosphorylase
MQNLTISSNEVTELVAGLNRVARNLWWTWSQEAQELFQELSPRGWQNLYHNAVAILHEVSEQELRARLQDHEFANRVREVLRKFNAYIDEPKTWGAEHAAQLKKNPVAYFSAEFGFHESLPIAAGGLGVLAGDHAKSASVLNPRNLAVEPVLDAKGEPLVCSVEIAMSTVFFQAWRVNVGRCPVFLLDCNRPENEQRFRDLTLRVYGGDSTTRIMQEIVLGVGGVRLIRALGLAPSVFHMNEGHAAFLVFELLREKMAAGAKYPQVLETTRKECISRPT